MRHYRWMALLLIVLIGCSEEGIEEGEDRIAAMPLPPEMHRHQSDIPDDLWGPDSLTDTDGIYIEWESKAETQPAGYHIYRSTEAANGYEQVGKVSGVVTLYEDRAVKLETKYYYRVTAMDEMANESRMSEPACYTLLRKPILTHPLNQAMLDKPPRFRWLGLGETGFYTIRVFIGVGEAENPFREIWRYETIDFDQFEVIYNQDGSTAESLLPGREYRWRVDFEERGAVGSESTWRFFQMRP